MDSAGACHDPTTQRKSLMARGGLLLTMTSRHFNGQTRLHTLRRLLLPESEQRPSPARKAPPCWRQTHTHRNHFNTLIFTNESTSPHLLVRVRVNVWMQWWRMRACWCSQKPRQEKRDTHMNDCPTCSAFSHSSVRHTQLPTKLRHTPSSLCTTRALQLWHKFGALLFYQWRLPL